MHIMSRELLESVRAAQDKAPETAKEGQSDLQAGNARLLQSLFGGATTAYDHEYLLNVPKG